MAISLCSEQNNSAPDFDSSHSSDVTLKESVFHGTAAFPAALHSIVYHGSLIGGRDGSLFDTRYVMPFLSDHQLREILLDPAKDAAAISCIHTAWQALAKEEPDYPLTLRYQLSLLSFLLLAHQTETMPADAFSPVREVRTQMMLAFVHRHFAEPIHLNDIAAAASISINEALRCSRQVIGLSPMQYLRKYRLSHAARLIAETNDAISIIAAQCGIPDSSYFAKSFREQYQMTPKEYRATYNGIVICPLARPHHAHSCTPRQYPVSRAEKIHLSKTA